MTYDQSETERVIARELSRIITERRTTGRALAEQLGRKNDFVNRRLRGAGPITIPWLEECLSALQITTKTFFQQLWPRSSARTLEIGLRHLDGLIEDFLPASLSNSRLRPFLDFRPKPDPTDTKFPHYKARQCEDLLWTSRETALNHTYFWLEDAKTHLEYAGALCCLAGLIRYDYPNATDDALLLLHRAIQISYHCNSPALNAYLLEKLAKTVWDRGEKQLAFEILDSPGLLHHPLLDSYFTIRGIYRYYNGDYLAAEALFKTAWELSRTPIAKVAVLQHQSLLAADTNFRREAFEQLDEATKLPRLTPRLRRRLVFTEALILRKLSAFRASSLEISNLLLRARDILRRLLHEDTDDEIRVYIALEFYLCDPPPDEASEIDPTIEALLDQFTPPPSPPLRATITQILQKRRQYSRAAPETSMRRQSVVPGS